MNLHGIEESNLVIEEDLNPSTDLKKLSEKKMTADDRGLNLKSAELLGNLSTELRAPLNSILGFASLLKEQNLSDADRSQFVDRIITNGDHLLQILEDALNFSKIEKGEVIVESVPFNLIEMVYDIAQSFKASAMKKNVDIHITFKNSIPEKIVSDPLKTRQILTNLIGNSIRYAEGDGFVLVSLSFEGKSMLDQRLRIEIDDSGAGPNKEPRIKEGFKFDELESSFNQSVSASSVRPGLALSRRFAEVLGGRLEMHKSELGDGQCFSLLLPPGELKGVPFTNKKKAPTLADKILGQLRKTNRLENVRILLAEDSEDNETLIRMYLSKEGAKITYVRNGLEAIDAVKNHEFDVILMDIQMPLLDGLEATRQIRQNGFKHPIIALTGQALRDDAEKSLKAGCDSHLTKPVRKESLVEEIQKRIFH